MKCVPLDTDVEASSSVSKGAVIGASIGGLVVAMILGFVVYRFCCSRRNGRRSMASAAEKENDFGMLKSARVCTRQHPGGDGD